MRSLFHPFRKKQAESLAPVYDRGWFPLIRESFAGAWQHNMEVDKSTALSYYAIFSCTTLIASDISKLRVKLVSLQDNVWLETTNPAYSPVINKPNSIQNRMQFWECWITSKLICGNTYILKQRDNRGIVTSLYVLNPYRVKPLVSSGGDVFYRLQQDNIAGVEGVDVIVPAREIIHDRWNCLFHPLVGISPLFANNLAATQGIRIQQNSISFFANASNPGGILTAPDHIKGEVAEEIKERWEDNFSGNNLGRVAILGNGLSFQKMSIAAVDAQLIEQARWTAEVVCATYHVPPYKIGIGQPPNYNNIQALNVEYYSQCLQALIEAAEICLDEGIGLGTNLGVEFDVENLLRMDSLLMADVVTKLTGGGVFSPNEARQKFNLGPVTGGDTPYLQQQNYSLAALDKRDTSEDPFGVRPTPTAPGPGETLAPPAKQEILPAPAPTKEIELLPTPNAKQLLTNAIKAKHLNRLLSNVPYND